MGFGRLAGRITTPLLLGSVFYLLLTPMGLVMRLSGRDPLRRGFVSEQESYRLNSESSSDEQMERPF